jgi:formamidopyrimidine-DNA glycosylase
MAFDDGTTLFFNDQRKFGWMKLYPAPEVMNIDFMRKVGPEPLDDSFTAKVFISRIRHRNNTTIKAAILDQTVLAGVGNIYADESLWGAKIHPSTRVKNVSDEQLSTLLVELKYVLNLAIEKGGSTDKNYVNAEGKRGSYIDFARVFRREGKECPRHPGTVIIKTRVAGRGTHTCPICQPAPL